MIRKNKDRKCGWGAILIATVFLSLQTDGAFAKKMFFERVFDERLAQQQTDCIDIAAFKSAKDQDSVQVVDVRKTEEFADGHIAGAENVPLDSLADNLDKISKDKKVIIHCQSGGRAAKAYSILRRHGFDNITVYPGGINEWKAKENELVK